MADFTPNMRSSPLTARDLNNVLRVLEDCEGASTLSEFRVAALEGMASYLGYRNTGFFMGATLELCFDDRTTLVNGPIARLAPQFVEHYHRDDLFAQPLALRLLSQRRVATLDQLPRPERPNLRAYLDNFLISNGIRAEMAFHIRGSDIVNGLISAVDSESGAFGSRDLAIAELLSRHLGNLLRWQTHGTVGTSPIDSGLSGRQTEVVALLAQGLTNMDIAKTLYITVDTVKKHLTHAMRSPVPAIAPSLRWHGDRGRTWSPIPSRTPPSPARRHQTDTPPKIHPPDRTMAP